ncbi:MAG: hypothetical protein LBE85_04880 [Candidatus Accumulibacter sp.]|jgi:hypothetical protein|nr:hypothetical protein [Accumulibacter sp.]
MRIGFCDEKQARIGIAGHAGTGHCHSHNQYLQEDSGGLAVVLTLFQEASGLPLTIRSVTAETGVNGRFIVETVSGGVGVGAPRRGITVHEARLARALEGRDAVRTQTLVMEAFGRIYGQGVHEAPVALQTAIANAAVDSFIKNHPERFVHAVENIGDCCGSIAGTIMQIDGIPLAVLATVNATPDGTGPVEDLEGNAFGGSKKKVMAALGMGELPTFIIEGKVYSPAYSDTATEEYFLVRADPVDDNPVVAAALEASARKLGYKVLFRDDVMKRVPGALEASTKKLGEAIIAAGKDLKNARFAQEKRQALMTLARLVSEDGAGVSFMSDRLHEVIGGTGAMPGTGAVISLIVPRAYHDAYVFPFFTEDEPARFVAVIKGAVLELDARLPQAVEHLQAHSYKGDIDSLLLFPSIQRIPS